MEFTDDGLLYDPDDLDAPAYETITSWSVGRCSVASLRATSLVNADDGAHSSGAEVLIWQYA